MINKAKTMKGIFVAASVACVACVAWAGRPAPSAANELLQLFTTNVLTDSPRVVAERSERFHALLAQMGRQAPPPLTDSSPEAEIVRIARDVAARPNIAKTLEKVYVNSWDRAQRAPSAPRLEAEHVGEKFRYAWEYIFIRSAFLPGAPRYSMRALEALSAIHNDASLSLIAAKCNSIGEIYKVDYSVAGQMHENYIENLGGFVSEKGLDTLIECASLVDQAQRGVEIHPSFRVEGAKLIKQILQPKRPTDRSIAWEEVVQRWGRNPAKREKALRLRQMLSKGDIP